MLRLLSYLLSKTNDADQEVVLDSTLRLAAVEECRVPT